MAEGDPLVIHDDLELFLTAWYRMRLGARPEAFLDGLEVDRVEPSTGTFPGRLIVIRDDGGPSTSLLTGERSVGVSVLAGTKADPQDAKDIARLAHALSSQIPSADPANPVSNVVDSTSPVLVPESQPHARAYFTLTLAVAGRLL